MGKLSEIQAYFSWFDRQIGWKSGRIIGCTGCGEVGWMEEVVGQLMQLYCIKIEFIEQWLDGIED
jgi:hypothetical protein